jgi:hypothetical protein
MLEYTIILSHERIDLIKSISVNYTLVAELEAMVVVSMSDEHVLKYSMHQSCIQTYARIQLP